MPVLSSARSMCGLQEAGPMVATILALRKTLCFIMGAPPVSGTVWVEPIAFEGWGQGIGRNSGKVTPTLPHTPTIPPISIKEDRASGGGS